jgi:hypothetical protein
MRKNKPIILALGLLLACLAADQPPIDFQRARELFRKQQQGQTLTTDEQQYLRRAMEARRAGQPATRPLALPPRNTTGLVPLCDMGPNDRYQGEDGGLYSQGRNTPPPDHTQAAQRELARIQPLNAQGQPAPDGKVVLLSIGMSNTTQEFSTFMRLAQRDPSRNPALVIVDGAAGGMDVMAWVEDRHSRSNQSPWQNAMDRIQAAGVTPQQIQVVWFKEAKMGPATWGEFPDHARKLADNSIPILNRAKEKFPNLRIAYLSSRIYAGHANGPLNPEPYAYESAFSIRWLIQQQIKGDAKLNYDPAKGPATCPLLLWGPYLWADGTNPRKSDGLVWTRQDLAADGTHPSPDGMTKVGQLLLKFFQTDPLARTWYLAP